MSEKSESALGALRNYYPDRAVRLAETVKKLNVENKTLATWREEQLIKFIEVLKCNAEELERSFAEKKAATMAWVTRNILELDVWIDYCNLSDAHAKRFKEDSMRDILGFFDAIHSMVKEESGKEHPAVKNALQLVENAMQKHFGIVDDKYLRIDHAAELLGQKKRFTYMNKMFSKFAHPTAWVVDTGDWLTGQEETCEGFLVIAVLMACGALTKIHDHILQRFPLVSAQSATP